MHRKKKKGFVKNITGIAQTKQNQEKSKLRQALCVQLNQGYILNLFKRAKAELFCAADSSSSRQMLPSMARSWAVLLLCLSACSGAHPLPLWDKHILQHCLRQSWRQEEQTLSWSSPRCFLHGKCQWGAPRYPRDSTSYLACFGFPQMSLLLLPPAPPPSPLCLSKYKPVHSTCRPKLLLHICGTVGLYPWIKVLHVKDAHIHFNTQATLLPNTSWQSDGLG